MQQEDGGSVLSYDVTLPPSLPFGKATSLKEGGDSLMGIPYEYSDYITAPKVQMVYYCLGRGL